MAGIRIILLPLGPASRTIFARLSTFRRHELSLLLFSFSLLAPGTHDTHCSCDDQRATISLSSSLTTTVISFLSRLLTRITAFSSSPSTFFSLLLSFSLFLSFSLWSQLLVKRFRFHGFGTRWNCPFLVYRPIHASFSRRFEGNFDSDTNLLVEQSLRLLFLWKLRKIFGEKFWSVGEKVESLLLLLLLLLFIKLFFLSFIAFIRYFVDIWKNNIMILYHVILTFGNGNFQWKIEVLRYLKYLWNKLFE